MSDPARLTEDREWIADFRAGNFSPSYYTKRWPVEMDGVVDAWEEALDRLAAAENVVEALGRLVADLETNSERGAPEYAHDALAAYNAHKDSKKQEGGEKVELECPPDHESSKDGPML